MPLKPIKTHLPRRICAGPISRASMRAQPARRANPWTRRARRGVASLSLTVMMTGCGTLPNPSKASFLKAALDATEPDPATRCDLPPPKTDFPDPRQVNIQAPIDDIDQGRAYGVAYKDAKDGRETDDAKLAAWKDYCARLIAADDKREADKAVIRAGLIKSLTEERKKVFGIF